MHLTRFQAAKPWAAAIFGVCLSGGAAAATNDQHNAEFLRPMPSFNPDISAIVDTYLHADNAHHGGIRHVHEEMSGFGQAHGGGDHGHDHGGLENGFNLRHVELQFSAAVDPYFKGEAIAAIDTDGAEIEVASITTTGLPSGLQIKAGKFYSGFGRINEQHTHAWDFVDRPLVYELLLGSHGLNEKGVQVSWLAPTPFYLLAGAEVFQGENERSFAYHGEEDLPERDAPRLGVGWLKLGPALQGRHALQLGASLLAGRHQEEHDGHDDDHGDGHGDHYDDHGDGGHDGYAFDGDSVCWGLDFVYKYDSPRPRGQGDILLQGEYFSRRKDLDLVGHDHLPKLFGNPRIDEQDGYYLQAVYGVLPRWRAGLRWEQTGLTNKTEAPDGDVSRGGRSDRAGVMLDFSPSEFSRFRAQLNHGRYETGEGREDVTQFFLQWTILLGAHGCIHSGGEHCHD